VTAPDGPHRVSSKLQVRLPIRLAKQLHIEDGDYFYWRASDDDPGTLQLIPAEIVERRYSAGERLEAAAREVAEELPSGELDDVEKRDRER
jgi:antitoxin component of MazEF toxin-antitoxin module